MVQRAVTRCQGGTPSPSLSLLPAKPRAQVSHSAGRTPTSGSDPRGQSQRRKHHPGPAGSSPSPPLHTPLRAPSPEPISGAPTPPLADTLGEAVGSSPPHSLRADWSRPPCPLGWSSGTASRPPAGHSTLSAPGPAPSACNPDCGPGPQSPCRPPGGRSGPGHTCALRPWARGVRCYHPAPAGCRAVPAAGRAPQALDP